MMPETLRTARPVGLGHHLPTVLGISSQLVNAGTNVATVYLASLFLAPDAFGTFAVGFAGVTVVLACARGLIGSSLLVHLPAVEPHRRAPLARSALGLAWWGTLPAVAALLVLAAVIDGTLVWLLPGVVFSLVQDVGRSTFLAGGRPGAALTLDSVWAVAQGATLVLGHWAFGQFSAGPVGLPLLALSWGAGALAGVLALLCLAGVDGLPSPPGPWMRASGDIAGWFTAVAVVAQVELFLVLATVGLVLGPADAGGLRAVQLLVSQPATVVLGAMLVLATPTVATAAQGPGGTSLRTVHRQVVRQVAPVVVGVAVVAALAGPLMQLLFPRWSGYAPLALPVALQTGLLAWCMPAMALLNGTRRGRVSLALHLCRSTVVVAGTALGGVLGGAAGAAWALAVVATVVLLGTAAVVRRELRRTPGGAR
ncbi:hypothetical protein [Pseudonocardia sp. ICBG601]|uniref:hypothetical protein n=1 Tax=Pseudonocardia sp. ICBG601 TaxID=2846759 RepID=UPI001CF67672|nr:hypothetical protein [Pseudonocardia sp. ICBG601]